MSERSPEKDTMKRNIVIIALLCSALVIASCVTGGNMDADTLSSAPPDSPLHQRRVVPGDTISITIWEIDQPKDYTARVKQDGTIDLMFITGLTVAGLTEAELNEYLVKELSTYYVRPRVTASLSAFVYLIGEVRNPGAYDFEKGQTLVSALAVAGGPTRGAKLRNTLVIRGDYNDNPTVIVSDASRLFRKGDLSENVLLQAGDIIYVPSTVIADVNYYITQIKPILDFFMLNTLLGL